MSVSAQFFDYTEWEDPTVVDINKEPAHVSFMSYENAVQALKNDYNSSPFYKLLNGNWKFNYSDKPDLWSPAYNSACLLYTSRCV